MRVVELDKDINGMLRDLVSDLGREDLIGLSRLPEPKVDERYRDMLRRVYGAAGIVTPIVWLEFDDGTKKTYVFVIRAEIGEEVESHYEAGGKVEGWVIEGKGGVLTHYSYRPIRFSSGAELLPKFDEMGDKYREAEVSATLKRAVERPEEGPEI